MNRFPAKRILVPVDFSPLSRLAWAWAKVFSGADTELETLFVYDLPAAPMLGMPLPSATSSPTLIRRTAARLREEFPGASARVVEGDAALAIARRAARADLLVMATHGRQGVQHALFGSVCEAVVRGAPAPLLTVRRAPRKISTVLAPVTMAPYARKGFRLAAEAAAFLGAQLFLLNVADEKRGGPNPRFYLNEMIATLPEDLHARVKPGILLRKGHAVREILMESRRHGLVVLTAHRKSLLTDLVLGTTAERVLRHARTPVLTAPSSEG